MRTALRLLPPIVAVAIALAGCSAGGNDKPAGDKAAGAAQAPAAQGGGQADQGGGAQAGQGGVDTDEKALTGETADKAKEAAMAAVPDGTFVRAEREKPGKPGVYGVQFRKPDGTIMEVFLNKSFKVVSSHKDDDD